jgi:hypothetical protein
VQNAALKIFALFESSTNLNVSPDFHEPRSLQWIDKRRNEAMTRFKLVGAAAILSMMVAPPVFAQAAIQEPGAFAFYHPNADVLDGGRPTPAAALGAMASVPFGGSDAYTAVDGGADGVAASPAPSEQRINRLPRHFSY